ncbi:toll/interleukin-1 receptor domain-containing protein [Bacillus pseudomycoides]|uniref:Toll/interleukin-1 receptor domain-containing protein n=1 Tax=Bacillus pseudomycoides TaxID=64104 RepID=A0AAJ1YXA2_9BACI|nr:toll/interleukin-1 receptor domain-containing protein [Bacillus pseudomycoides]MDR4325860.1 toll/interleukin-1 receptor domain-containing protein [Bacillus pseudomycoides]MED1535667.1 toll/interleukin-1 receptor domain-containing protein [Bacillus pseudomycoides]PFZ91884.1 hypothetical protein COL70_11600 [Bacillus pseudomycoides]PHD08131.1 hypothetical protein COF46_23760 [Bacillus pseudomycoides]
MEWDVFISHASEDKNDFVKPLAKILQDLRLKVWYDEFTLRIGDSLSTSINKGLISSKYGLVVISKSFIGKGWPDYELQSLISREIGKSKVILPIWHNVTREDIMSFSPFLADKFALNSTTSSIEEIAMQIVEVVNPEIYYNIIRIYASEAIRKSAEERTIPISAIKIPNPRHDKLPQLMLNRIMIIQKTLYDVFPEPLRDTILKFRSETNPERELIIWEAIAATYLQFTFAREISIEKRKEIYKIILQFTLVNELDSYHPESIEHMTIDEYIELKNLYKIIIPNIHTGILVKKE